MDTTKKNPDDGELFDMIMSHASSSLDNIHHQSSSAGSYGDNTIFAGWVFKRGETVKSWRKRYLKVTPKEVSYGKEKNHVLKSFPRSGIKTVVPFAHSDAPKDYKEYGMKIIMEKRALKVAVQTQREQESFIYHISPRKVFGTDLNFLMNMESHAHANGPVIIEQCIHELTKNGKLATKGLFRVSGGEGDLREISHIYDTEYITSDENGNWSQNPVRDVSIHVVAGLLKKYLRELPESIIPSDQYDDIIQIFQEEMSVEERIKKVRDLLTGHLTRNHYVTLNMVCFVLYQTHLHNDLMKASNLGLVMGQNICIQKNRKIDMNEVMLMAKIAEFLVAHYEEIFDKNAEYLHQFQRNIEEYSQIAKEKKDKICKQLALLKEEANEIDEAMSKLSEFAQTVPEFSDQLYSQIYHAVYHVRPTDGDEEKHAESVPVSYKSLYLDDQLKKYDLQHLVETSEEDSDEEVGSFAGHGSQEEEVVQAEAQDDKNCEQAGE